MVICITGMHRSGTSLVAGVVNLLGVDFGPPETMLEPGEENPRGFWEQAEMADLNDDILAALGGSWRDLPALPDGWELSTGLDGLRARAVGLVARLFGVAAIAGWKDPRTSVLLPFWRTIAPVSASVLVYRDPREVGQSLAHRDGMDPEQSAYLWLRYFVAAWRNDPRNLRVHYARLFDDLDRQLTLIRDFLGLAEPTPAVRAAIDDLVDPSMRRAKALGDSGPMMRRALKLFHVLQGSTDEVEAEIERLDGVLLSRMPV
jgi:hypothetical protein